MDRKYVLNELYKKYIEPTRKKRESCVGVEIEMPIVNLNKEAVDFEVVHSLTGKFIENFDFNVIGKDDDGNIYAAQSRTNGDILSYDCSYNNLELSFGKENDLNVINGRFRIYYDFIGDYLSKYNYTLTGMGVNPYWRINRNVPIENGRYRMLFHHLQSFRNYDLPMYFHSYPEYGTFSSASQVQLDVEYEKLPIVLNTFSKLEPIKALLFSNSVLIGEDNGLLCCRDMFWENSTHGINPHNIGMYDCEFGSVEEILNYIGSDSIYCVERGDKYINFEPINVIDYLGRKSVNGEYFDQKKGGYSRIEFEPDISDLSYLRTFKFEDLTYRGTVEFRSVCCQPVSDFMSVAAFHVGLMNNVEKLSEILEKDTVLYHNGYTASELRKLFVKDRLPEFVDENGLYELAERIVDLSKEALTERGLNEEKFLDPLYVRIKNRTNPAETMKRHLSEGKPIEEIIKAYG